MEIIKKFFNHEWIKNISWSVIGGLILLFITKVIFKLPILSTIIMGVKYIGVLLAFQIPVYIMLIALVVIPLTWRYLLELKNRRSLDGNNNRYLTATDLTRLSYTADKFEHTIWKWEWKYNELLKRYEVKNVAPLCPNDTTCENIPMIPDGFNDENDVYLFKCQNCNTLQGLMSDTNDIVHYVEKRDYST
ncbi:hypothetical protein ACEN2P_21310 [Pedobacter psychrotolerans]|uniref:hypothetical protein n=1 Tax=Pedobacter psychrotolerans TaxID=1843235 RepID=UPI003F94D238